jgi:O-antigen/teichoic acid export membrane protein
MYLNLIFSFTVLRALRGASNMVTIPFIMVAFGEGITAEFILIYYVFGLIGVFINLGLTQAGNNILLHSRSGLDYKFLSQINSTRSLLFLSCFVIIPLLYIFNFVSINFILSLGYLFIPLILPMEWLVNYYNKSKDYLRLRVSVTAFMSVFRVIVCLQGLPNELLFLSLTFEGILTFTIIKKKQRFFEPIIKYPKCKDCFYFPNIKLWCFDILNSLKNRMDIYILSIFFVEGTVGYYGVLLTTLNMIPLITNSIMTVALPRIVSDKILKKKIIITNLLIVLSAVLLWMGFMFLLGRHIYGVIIFDEMTKYIYPTALIGLMYGVNQAANLNFLADKLYQFLLYKTFLIILGIIVVVILSIAAGFEVTPIRIICVCALIPILIDSLYLRLGRLK